MAAAININLDSIITTAILTVAITFLVYGISRIDKSSVVLGALLVFVGMTILTVGLNRTPGIKFIKPVVRSSQTEKSNLA